MKLIALAFAFLLLPQQQPQAPVVHGKMEGTVLREGTTEPVSGAKVTVTRVNASTGATLPTAGTINTFLINPTPNVGLPGLQGPPPGAAGPAQQAPPQQPVQPPPIPTITTDHDGKFVVPDLDEGSYRLVVTLNGYVKQEYGQRSFTGQGSMLTLGKGETLKDLVVRMTRAANVTGRISDENGLPASGVPVRLIKSTYNINGIRLFQQVGTARTNDRGEYRLYWMTPGHYYLVAGTPPGIPPAFDPGGVPSPNETPDPYTFTYYPGTTDQARAMQLELKAGAEIPMDFTVPHAQLYKISGRIAGAPAVVNGPNGPTPANVGLSLGFLRLEGGSGFLQMSQSYEPASGNFELRNVVPGSYALQANSGAATARAVIDVVNSDLSNIVLNLSGGVNITGKVQMAGAAPLPSGPVRIQMRPYLKGVTHFVGLVPVAPSSPADGTFRLDRVLAGEYRISAAVTGHYVKELRFDNQDALNSSVQLTDDASAGPSIEVILSPNVAQIDGIVTDEKLQRLPGVQVVLVPNQNRDRADLFKAATTDQAGRYNMRDIAPGDYKLFAWEALDGSEYFDADFLKQYEVLGKAVHVDESAKLAIDTKVIPAAAP
jgi:hypothetical protein